MDLFALISYGAVNTAMALFYLKGKGQFCNFPFWMGVISMGWFFPQAVGGLRSISQFPEGAYARGLFFATLCSIATWVAYVGAVSRKTSTRPSWLDAQFNLDRLYWAGAGLCMMGFFFEWKLSTLPEEMLQMSQWSGATVKYLFLASIFKFGFLALWLIYISQNKRVSPRLLVFLIPSFLLLIDSAVIGGRRAEMMNLTAYVLICPWFVRRATLPRGVMITALLFGLILINSIGIYRSIMHNSDASLGERFQLALKADYTEESKEVVKESGYEFRNYIFYRHVAEAYAQYDYGLKHWNGLVFNYVPAQIVGRTIKDGLMIPYKNQISEILRKEYNHASATGTTLTGYADAFTSFWWLGFLKFSVIGWMMGVLYRHAMQGHFLGQLLYVYTLGSGMHAVTHGTHSILVSIWVYFFALAYPVLYWARQRENQSEYV